MFLRVGHKVEIIRGVDSGAVGTLIDIDSDVYYIEKTEGMFKEMYDTHNIYGFELADFKVTVPCIKPRDKVQVLTKEECGVDLPEQFKGGEEFKVAKATADTCTVNVKGEAVVVPSSYFKIVEGVEPKQKVNNISVKVNDVVFFRKGRKTYMGKIVDKYGVNYVIESRNGEGHEVKKSAIFKKISVKEMADKIKKDTVDKDESEQIKSILKELNTLKSLGNSVVDGEYDDYKRQATRRLKSLLSAKYKKNKSKCFEHKGYKKRIESAILKNPNLLKRQYWNFMKELGRRPTPATNKQYKEMFGVEYYKSGNVYDKAGTFAKINKRLKASDLILSNKRPYTNSKYVGVEIEMYSKYDRNQLNTELTKAGLGRNVSLITDSSIKDYGDKHPLEVRILATERTVDSVLKRTLEVLKKAEAEVNLSCGLHVHLDMRHRKVNKAFRNLINAQDMLFKFCHKSRSESRYCKKVLTTDFNRAVKNRDHYDAISADAYRKHKSLEIRMLEGSLDHDKITNWIKLLVGIVESKGFSPQYDADRFLKQLKSFSTEQKDYFKQQLAA